MTTATATMHLIEDELVVFPVRGKPESFRLRIWRARDNPAAVIVSPTPGGPDPACVTGRIANLVLRTFLGYLPEGMDYIEVNGKRQASLVTFDAVGADHRVSLIRPERVPVHADEIDALIGTHVEL